VFYPPLTETDHAMAAYTMENSYLGKELGEAHKQRMLTLLGAIGGAVAGRQIERQASQSTHYEVDLRLADGTLLRRRYEQAPPFAPGATIRLGTPARGAAVPSL